MTNVKKVVDADTHISESESMWELFDREMYKRRPVLVSVPDNTLYGDRNAFWLIDGNIFPKPAGKGGFNLITPSVAKRQQLRTDIAVGCRDLTDPETRLKDMDRLGFDVQVIYPTLFLIYLTDDVGLQLLALEVVLLAGVALFYSARLDGLPLLALTCVIATAGMAAAGTLYGVLAAGLRVRDTLLPLLLLPVLAPVLIGSTRTFEAALDGRSADAWPWLGLLTIFALTYVGFGAASFGPLLEEP